MKKLKLNFQHLGNAEVLTRSQLKQIMGGNEGSGGGSGGACCCAHTGGWYTCGMTMQEAKDKANELAEKYGQANWCCASCNIPNPCVR